MKAVSGLFFLILTKFSKFKFIRAIRNGLSLIIPVLLTGSFTLVLMTIPISEYQNFIHTFFSGSLYKLLHLIYSATLGMLSIYLCLSVSLNYALINTKNNISHIYSMPILSLVCMAVSCGFLSESFDIASFGPQGMATAIFVTLIMSNIYLFIYSKLKINPNYYTRGVDSEFHNAMTVCIPMLLTIIFNAVISLLFFNIFNVENFQSMFIGLINILFNKLETSFLSTLIYVFISSILWFFGIHGKYTLDHMANDLFLKSLESNITAVASGRMPVEIYTKTFIDVFVMMGGCGSVICLLFALFFASRQHSNRSLVILSSIPTIFNFSELLIFGLPVVFNPIMFIPFILTPIICLITSSGAMIMGIVPLTNASVMENMPILWSGYMATGSISGVILQIFNIGLGICLYWPFVKLNEHDQLKNAVKSMNELVGFL